MSLTKAQKKAYNELTDELKPASELAADMTTLNALVSKGFARRRAPQGTHKMDPKTIYYGRK